MGLGRLLGGVVVLEVRAHGVSEVQGALLAGGPGFPVVVQHEDFHVRHWSSDASTALEPFGAVDHRDDRAFGGAVVLDDLRPPPVDQAPLHHGRAGCCAMEDNLERRTVERGPALLIQLEQALHLGRNQVDAGAPVGVDEVQNASAVVPVLHHHRRPAHHGQKRERPLGRVVEGPAEDGGSRQRHEIGEAGGDELPHFGRRAGFGGGQTAPDALGMPGCSRGVEHRSTEGLVLRFGVRPGAEERLEVGETRIARGADGHRQFHGGGPGVGKGFGSHVGEAVANQDSPGTGVLDDVGHFRGHEMPADGHEHDAGV